VPVTLKKRGPTYPADLLQSPLYSRTCQEALRIMERLCSASVRHSGSRKLDDLSAETGLSIPDLEQVLHFLRLAGLVEATRTTGGVRLARPASRISLLQIVRAIDGAGLWRRCILGLEECSDQMPCPAHDVWKETRFHLERHLESQSLLDLARALTRRQRAHRSQDRERAREVHMRMTLAEGLDTAGDR
jgi:Rrf2 family iron-sulfur cluster assembly transcriptional regulator